MIEIFSEISGIDFDEAGGHTAFFISAEVFTANKLAAGRSQHIADLALVQSASALRSLMSEAGNKSPAENGSERSFLHIEARFCGAVEVAVLLCSALSTG